MVLSARAVPLACSVLLACAAVSAVADPTEIRYWAWAPGCSSQDLGTTTLCWSDRLRLPSGSGNVGGASRPDGTIGVLLLQDGASTLPVSFASGTLSPLGMLIGGVDAPAQVGMSGGTLTTKSISVGAAIDVGVGGGSVWTSTGQLVQSGGAVNVTDLFVGSVMPGTAASLYDLGGGTLSVEEVVLGSSWRNLQTGPIQQDGPGRLTVLGSAVATVGYTLKVEPQGVLDLRGGLLNVGRLQLATPAGLQFSGGTLQITGQQSEVGAAPSFGSIGAAPAVLRVATGATASFAGELAIGAVGRGELQVVAGARLTTASATLGKGSGLVRGDGAATVAGAGADWTVTGVLDIGGATGTIVSGVVIADAGGRIGVGELRVRGTGSLQVAGGARVEAGSLWVSPGGEVTLRDGQLGTAGGLNVEGQVTVLAGEISRFDGPLTLADQGRLQIDAGQASFGGPLSFEVGSQWHNDGEVFTWGEVQLRAGVALTGTGTKFVFGRLALSEDYLQATDTGAVALMDGSVLDIDLGGEAGHDRYAASRLILGGTLQLRSADGYHGRAGDSFDLLDGPLFGQFGAIDTSAFALGAGLAWDFSQLGTEGVVAITTAVPEPAGAALMLMGLVALGGGHARLKRRPAAGGHLVLRQAGGR